MEVISVHDLLLDRSLNPRRQATDPDVVEHYASIFKEVIWPPILVHRGTHKLLDGWHRVEAAKRAGVYSLPVLWVDAKEEELFALAVKANLGHGLRLTREERYQAIHRLMREAWTPERIAETLGCALGMVDRTEKAEDLRIKFKVQNHPGAALPLESLVEVIKLPPEFQDEIADLACEVEAGPSDVRRTVRAVKKGEVESSQEIRRTMTDPMFLKARHNALPELKDGNWLLTFATLIDQMEAASFSVSAVEHEAAVSLFRRLRQWADRHLAMLGEEESSLTLDTTTG